MPVADEVAGAAVLVLPDFDLVVAFEHGDVIAFEPIASLDTVDSHAGQAAVSHLTGALFPNDWQMWPLDTGEPVKPTNQFNPFVSSHSITDLERNEVGFALSWWNWTALPTAPAGFVITEPPFSATSQGVSYGAINLVNDEQIVSMSYARGAFQLAVIGNNALAR